MKLLLKEKKYSHSHNSKDFLRIARRLALYDNSSPKPNFMIRCWRGNIQTNSLVPGISTNYIQNVYSYILCGKTILGRCNFECKEGLIHKTILTYKPLIHRFSNHTLLFLFSSDTLKLNTKSKFVWMSF